MENKNWTNDKFETTTYICFRYGDWSEEFEACRSLFEVFIVTKIPGTELLT